MKLKGTRFERELLNKLWQYGFAAVRSAGSGAMSFPSPDIVAGNGKRFLAIEVKMRSSLPLYISEDELKELIMFSNLFGAEAYIALKISYNDWKFFTPENLEKTKKGYKIGHNNYLLGIDIEELTGRSVQERFH
jgi:Holliday junction resolvase